MDNPLPIMALVIFYAAGPVAMIYFPGILQNALRKCAPASRTMTPGKVWLTLIPLFGLVWQFFVVLNVADSLEIEFKRVGIPCRGLKQSKGVGTGMCICDSCVLVPVALLKHLILAVGFALLIAYCNRIANFTRALDARPSAAPGFADRLGLSKEGHAGSWCLSSKRGSPLCGRSE
ncbi:MAG TPA: hypothetical protein VME18_12600 [Acidobacteriaceae bacterium]|nr:hypothetical protein [Acidobacteriaceae bacterium]